MRIIIDSLMRVRATLIVTMIASGVMAVDAATNTLQFDRVRLALGHVYQLFTGHLTHWNMDHFAWDIVTFIVLGAYCELQGRGRFLTLLAVSAIAISAGNYVFLPDMTFYRGLSGIDSALFAFAAMHVAMRAIEERRMLTMIGVSVVLVASIGKLVLEMVTGNAIFVSAADSFVIVPLAHVLGMLVGVLMCVWGGRLLRSSWLGGQPSTTFIAIKS